MRLTYGHAMNEFCFFRWHTKKFLFERFKKLNTVHQTGVFSKVNNAINGVVEHCPTAAFYHEGTQKRENDKINHMINEMIKKDYLYKQCMNDPKGFSEENKDIDKAV